jgi:hypothetical protein
MYPAANFLFLDTTEDFVQEVHDGGGADVMSHARNEVRMVLQEVQKLETGHLVLVPVLEVMNINNLSNQYLLTTSSCIDCNPSARTVYIIN